MTKMIELRYTPVEEVMYEILKAASGNVVERTTLVQACGKPDETVVTAVSNVVDVHIKNLRRKLPRDRSIETVRSIGYRLV